MRLITLAALAALPLSIGSAPATAMSISRPATGTTGSAPRTAAAAAFPTVLPPLLRQAVAELPVATEQRDGYKRTSFRHWVDADADACTARAEVLIAEAIDAPAVDAGCLLTGGAWYSYYDDVVVEAASKLDVDHLVPLAEAWDSGASTWDAARRQAYANDLDAPEHLVAVTARSNRQKA